MQIYVQKIYRKIRNNFYSSIPNKIIFTVRVYNAKRHVNTLNNNYYIIWNCIETKTILREKKLKAT